MARRSASLAELKRLALPHVRAWPGCAGVGDIAIELDQDGEWFIAVIDLGSAAQNEVSKAAIAVQNELRKQYILTTDT